MKMTDKTVINISEEQKKFNRAVDLFFGMNPANKYILPYMMFFAKNKWLKVVEKAYEIDGIEIASLDVTLKNSNSNSVIGKFEKSGKTSLKLIAAIDGPLKKNIISDYIHVDDYVNNINKGNDKLDNIFLRYRFEPMYIFEIADILINLPSEWYEKEGYAEFNSIINRIQGSSLNIYGFLSQPSELTRLVMSILNVKEGRVYNPYAGFCSYSKCITPDVTYEAQEINKNICAIGNLVCLFNGSDRISNKRENSFSKWHGCEDFDYIVSTPPIHTSCSSPYKYLSLDYLVRSAKDTKNKSIGVFASKELYNNDDSCKDVFKLLIDNDWLESVILLPNKLVLQIGGPLSIVVINKNKERKGFVKFVNASEESVKSRHLNLLDAENILNLLNSSDDTEKVCCIANSEIQSNDYNIYPCYYTYRNCLSEEDSSKLIQLDEILSVIPRKRKRITDGRIFTLYPNIGLETGILEGSKLEKNEDEELSFSNYSSEDCVVLRLHGFIDPQIFYMFCGGETVMFRGTYKIFRLDTYSMLPEFFINECRKNYFIKQLFRFFYRGRRLSLEDFLKLKINKPALDEQEKIVMSVKNAKLDDLIALNESELKNQFAEFKTAMHERKHAVGQVIKALHPSIRLITSFVKKNETMSKDSIVSRKSGTTLEEYLDNVGRLLGKIEDMVDNFTSEEHFGTPKSVNVYDVIKSYCDLNKVNEVFRTNCEFLDGKPNHIYVSIAEKDLIQMLDNLFTNAVKYGFVDKNRNDYQIRILVERVLKDGKLMCAIKVSNNGVPASMTIDPDFIFSWGAGQGSGIGCTQVKEIAEHFGGKVEYNEYPNDPEGFVCEFVIMLPLI